jgi:hypothetical protein
MGTKFANIQIKESDMYKVEVAIKEYLADIKNDKESSGYYLYKMYKSYPFYIGQIKDNWVTIIHSAIEWGNVGYIADELSKYYKGVIMAIGYFDDDVFGISIIKDQQELTQHVSGPNVEFYAGKERIGNADTFINELKLTIDKTELKKTLKIDDLEKKVNTLEKYFDALLWIKTDWLDQLDENMATKFKEVYFE